MLINQFLVNMVSHAQSTQNNKFSKSLQYFNKEMRDEVDFSTSWYYHISWAGPGMPKVLKITSM